MAKVVTQPQQILAHGHPPKVIEEFAGQASTGTTGLSIARMVSPAGWSESGQTPEFDEYTLVLRGELQVETKEQVYSIAAGQAIIINGDEWVRYSTPGKEGAEYIAVCLPAFSPKTVHRDV